MRTLTLKFLVKVGSGWVGRRTWPQGAPPHKHTHNIGCSGGMWGSTSHLPQAAGRVSQSLTHDSKHTPPCDTHTFTHTHAATTLPTPLLSAGLPQQLGCAGAGVLSELARQVFPLQENPSGLCQTYPQSTSHPNAPGPRHLCLAKLACSQPTGRGTE